MRALESATLGKNTESISKGEEKENKEKRENDGNVEGEQGEKKLKERAVAIDDRTEELSVESIKNRVRACSSGVSELDMERALAGKTSEEIKRIENESRQVAAGVVTESLGYLKEMLGNVPGSAKRVVEGIGSAAVHPVRTVHETFDLIFTVLAGKLERMFGYENLPEQQALEKMRSDFGKTHGSIFAELETLKRDPVGEGLAIASIVMGGMGMAREAVGLAGKMGSAGRVAEIEQAGAIVRTGEGVIKAEQAVSRGVPVEETADTAFSVGKMIGEAGSEGEFSGAVSLETKVATLGVGGESLNRTKEVEEVFPDAEFPVETTEVPAMMKNVKEGEPLSSIFEKSSQSGLVEKINTIGAGVGVVEGSRLSSGELYNEEKALNEDVKITMATLIKGKDVEEIYKIFNDEERDQSTLLGLAVDLFRKNFNLTEEEKGAREVFLNFIETNPSFFERMIGKDPGNISNVISIYSSLMMHGNEIQREIATDFLKEHLDLLKQVFTGSNSPNYFKSNTFLVRLNILNKGDDEMKLHARQWLEDMINEDIPDDYIVSILQELYGKDNTSLTNLTKAYMERHDLPLGEFLKSWKMAKIELVPGFSSVKALEDRAHGSAKFLSQEFNIFNFARYPTNVLVDQYVNRDNVEKPYGVIIFPVADWNGAFNDDKFSINVLYEKIKDKYLLRIVESDGKFALGRSVVSLNKKYGDKHKISFAILGGHGTKDTIQLGPITLKKFFENAFNRGGNIISRKDFEGSGFKRILSFFEKNPAIALVSCSTGKKGGIGQKISETYGAEVDAPNKPSNLIDFGVFFDSDGRIKFDTEYNIGSGTKKYFAGKIQKEMKK